MGMQKGTVGVDRRVRRGLVLGLGAALAVLVGCNMDQDRGGYPTPPSTGGAGSGDGDGDLPPPASDDLGLESDSPSDPQGEGPGGLTAGVWDDNLNYAFFSQYLDDHADLSGVPALSAAERDASHEAFSGDRAPRAELDVAIVFDTTGSMGDELSYLTAELATLAAAIDGVATSGVRWSLIVYRDQGDDYVTRVFPFGSVEELQARLGDQQADGGGDYPEASEAALAALGELDWRTGDDVARMAFWITDAPHHPGRVSTLTAALQEARVADLHLYPVAASGVDELAELTMRSAAQLTGGRYLFLTDDSGIGDAHKEPTIPCYFVTLLSDAMARMAKIELTGVYVEPGEEEVIRVGGDPQNGACTLDDGTEVLVF